MTEERESQGVVPQPAAKPAAAEVFSGPSAAAEAESIMADEDGPYWDSGHRHHRATVDRVTELLTAAHGSENAIAEDGASEGFHDRIEEALSAPATPEDYDWHVELADGQEYDSEADAAARQWFHQADIPNVEAQSLVNQYQRVIDFDEGQRDQMKAETLNSLHAQWGADFNKNIAAIRSVAQSAGPEFIEMLEESGMGNSHELFQTLLRVAKQRREFAK
ncbi:hypothetical protein OAJ57_03670 [Alphaproteobacteria bacterium]|nr:hypothetical protein [Alphaproteobacteria bacterium]